MKISSVVIASFLLSISASFSSYAQDEQWGEWQINVSAKNYNHYLDYPGSLIHSMTKVAITCAQPDSGEQHSYEEFLFSTKQILGCRRRSSFGITSGTAGFFHINTFDPDQVNAIANSVERVMVELMIKSCSTKYIVVSSENFDLFVSTLCEKRFHKPTVESGGARDQGNFTVEITSDSQTKSQQLFLSDY